MDSRIWLLLSALLVPLLGSLGAGLGNSFLASDSPSAPDPEPPPPPVLPILVEIDGFISVDADVDSTIYVKTNASVFLDGARPRRILSPGVYSEELTQIFQSGFYVNEIDLKLNIIVIENGLTPSGDIVNQAMSNINLVEYGLTGVVLPNLAVNPAWIPALNLLGTDSFPPPGYSWGISVPVGSEGVFAPVKVRSLNDFAPRYYLTTKTSVGGGYIDLRYAAVAELTNPENLGGESVKDNQGDVTITVSNVTVVSGTPTSGSFNKVAYENVFTGPPAAQAYGTFHDVFSSSFGSYETPVQNSIPGWLGPTDGSVGLGMFARFTGGGSDHDYMDALLHVVTPFSIRAYAIRMFWIDSGLNGSTRFWKIWVKSSVALSKDYFAVSHNASQNSLHPLLRYALVK